ncbi:MAG: metal-dependent transcriptional regulator [Chloroflexota bacterium]|nr:metal-dependent transcriptional regulator [Chloroflexota bacterium]
MPKTTLSPLSESIQMYLVTIVRLRMNDHPVPLSQLADDLSISPVSANEMCRKLQDHGLVIYQPYKGASLTEEGEQRAYYVLRRHRLWEVFLVDKLGLDYDQSHADACQLEHATSELLADRLDAFLGYPAVNPRGEPIPRTDASIAERALLPLAKLSTGQHGHVIRCDVNKAALTFLDEQGIRPGALFAILATAEDSLLVQVGNAHISLVRSLAEAVQVELDEEGIIAADELQQSVFKEKINMDKTDNQIQLHELKVGQHGTIVHVGGKGPAKRRMMDMGLVPGSEVKVVRLAPLGDPIEFTVKGYSLSLRKSEASNIKVEISE